MVAEIFSLLTLDSSSCVTWCRVLLHDVGSSSSHPLDPEQHSRYLMLAYILSLRQCRKRNGRSSCRSCRSFVISIGLIQRFSTPQHFSLIDTYTFWKFRIGTSAVNVKQYSILFSNFWKSELYYAAAFLTDRPSAVTVVCSTVDKTWNKESVWAKLKMLNDNLPIKPSACVCVCVSLSLSIYIYIYILIDRLATLRHQLTFRRFSNKY